MAEKTGYPQDMLELDLDLEADLGVDTVKQAETFAAVRDAYGIERQENLKLRDFPTLRSVVGFVYQFRPDLRPAVSLAPAVASAPAVAPAPAMSPAAAAPVGIATGAGAVAAPPTAAAGGGLGDPVVQKVLAIVAEKTGYPQDMLELDLDLEADLGVDTVKQAETFAAVREAYGIARQENLKLRDFPTLRSVVGFVYQFRPDLKPVASAAPAAVAAAPASAAAPAAALAAAPAKRGAMRLEDADKMPRRVPVPSLRPALELCQPTGVSLANGSRVVVAADEGGVAQALASLLEKRGVSVLTLEAGTATGEVTARVATWLQDGAIQGVFWLPALDVEPLLAELDLAGFREANRRRVKNLHAAMRALYESVAAAGTFLVSATRMGGLHGQTPEGATAPLGGAVAGFTKAYKRERADVLVKVVDFAPGAPAAEVADGARGGDARRPGRRRGRTPRRSALDDHARGAAGEGRPARTRADEGHGLRRDRRRRWHHERDRGRPGRRERWHLLPARPGRGAGAGRSADRSPAAGPREAEGRADRGGPGEGREADAGHDRQADHGDRAGRGGAACRRVRRGGGRQGALAFGEPARRPRGHRDRRRDQEDARPDRRARPRGRHRDQPQALRQGGEGVRPRLRHQGRRLLQPAAGRRGHAARRHGRLQLDRRPLRQRRADGLQLGERPACARCRGRCGACAPRRARSRSTGRPGAGSAWPRAARSRRSWPRPASRCCRPSRGSRPCAASWWPAADRARWWSRARSAS